MESKHTATPWTKRDIEIIGPYMSNKSICEMTGNFMDEGEAMANLNHIVTCVNTHDELVERLNHTIVTLKFAMATKLMPGLRQVLLDQMTSIKETLQKVN